MKRLADPYRDLDVIDSRAPRFNQATIGALSALAVATSWWWLLGILAAQLVVGLTLGRRFCLPCLAYFELVQPRFGEGPLEDARPPRFANMVGAVSLTAATASYAAGLAILGAALGGIVAALALIAAATGLHRLRGIQDRLVPGRPPLRFVPCAGQAGDEDRLTRAPRPQQRVLTSFAFPTRREWFG